MNKLISIIVPVYKVEKYLVKCVDSIINQTYSNLEIILVDDGSPDMCPKICDKYAEKDSRIKVIHKENGGLSDARNHGIDIATGDYITFIDSDDFYELDLFEKFIENITNKDCDIYCFKTKEIYENNQSYEFSKNKNIVNINNIHCMKDILDYKIVCNKIFARKLFINTRFPIGKNFEDIGTTYKLILNSKNIIVDYSEYYGYLKRNDSITGSMTQKSIMDRIYLENERFEFIKEKYDVLRMCAVRDRVFQIYRYHLDCCKYLTDNRKKFYNSELLKSEYLFFCKNYKNCNKKTFLSRLLRLNRKLFYIFVCIVIKLKNS